MNSIAKRLLATIMLVCVLMSYIAPAAVAAGTSSETVVYDFHLQDDKNMVLDGYFITNYGTDFRLSQILDDVEGFYADGSLNWKYAGASAGLRGTSADEENLPVGVRFSKSYGTRVYSSVGDWLAYTIKSPGTGTYTLSLNYALSYNNGIVATYILPADTQDIIGATDPSNRVGLSNISDSTGVHYNEGNRDANKVYQGFHAYAGNWTFEADKEYIVVFEVYKGSSFNGKGQMHLFGLEMTPGKVDPSAFDQQTYNDTVSDYLVKENVIPVADAGAMAAVWEVNGQDLYFLPIEGGRLLVFNLDTWELINSVESGISYPTSTAVLEKEDGTVEVYVGGNGTKMFVYNPYTEESYATPRFDSVSGMEDESAIRGIYAYEDKVYVGLSHGGHLAVYDPKTKTCENLGDMIAEEFSSIEGEEGEVSGDETGGISAITCYGGYLYMTAGSLTQYRLVKFDLSAKKVVTQWDVTSILGACSSSRGLAVLGNGDYLLAGGNGFSGLAMINLSTQKLVTNAEAKALGLSDKALVYGAYGMATEPINGKQYVTTSGGLYEYNHSTKKFSYVGDATNPFVTSGKQCVTLKVDETTKTLSETAPTQLYLFTMAGGGQVRLYNPSESSPIRGKKIGINGLMKEEYGTNGAQVRINTTGENRDDTKLYLGAFNTPLSAEYNVLTGEFTHYRTGGQTDSQVWYDGKLYAGNYSMCVVYEIDMENSDNHKPVIANMSKYDQKRIHTLAAGDGHIFAGTIPTTYLNGGGIGIYNTATGEEDFIHFKKTATAGEKCVPAEFSELWDLAVKGLAYSDGLLYGATTRAGGSSSQYADGTSAQIFVYDYKNGKILDTLDLREYIPDHLPAGAIDFIGGIVADPVVEGRFWGSVSDVLFTFSYDRSAKTWDVQVVYDYEHEIYNTSGGRASWNLPIVFDEKNNNVYVSLTERGIVRVHLSDWENIGEITTELTLATSPMFMELGADDNLYYGSSADLRMVPVNLTDAEWAQAKAWDAAVLALDANAENLVADVQALQASYEAMPVRVKLLVQSMEEFQDAEAEVFEKQILEETTNVTSDSVETLEALLAQYNGLTDRQKRYVKTYDTLTQAYAQAAQLREAELQQANAVQEQIDALNVTSLGDAQAVADARNAYEALNDRQKLLVDTAKLETAEALIEELKTVSAVQGKIDNLPETISLKDEELVIAARQAYEALSDVAKAQVKTAKLIAAEDRIQKLKDATKTKHIYDFNLYENEAYIQYVKDTLIKAGAPADMVVEEHHLYKYTYATNITVQSYKWFPTVYPGSLNWTVEGGNGIAPGNFGKDYNVTTDTGLQLSFEKPSVNTKQDYAGIRIHVPAAGSYKIDLSLYQGTGSSLSTGDVLEVYIFPAYEDYQTSTDNQTQMAEYLTDENLVTSLTYTTLANATDTATYTISDEFAFEKGEYIVAIREATTNTCRYVCLDKLTLTKTLFKVQDQVFTDLEDAFDYQAEVGAEYVSLNQDLQLTDLVLQPSQILNLNGHRLTVDSVLAYASSGILDNSKKDTGVLKILAEDGNMLSADNAQLPIYDAAADGYRFFEISVKSVATTGKGGENPKYWFQVSCVNFDEIYKLIQAGSELNITVKMSWNGGEAEAIASIDFLKQWASAYSSNESIYITVSAVNTEGLEDFTLIPALAANGVFVQGKQM